MSTISYAVAARIPLLNQFSDRDRSSVVITGVYINAFAGSITMAATNGKVLAEEVSPYEGDDFVAILDGIGCRKYLPAFLRTIPRERRPDGLTMKPEPNRVTLSHRDGSFSISKIQGTFPPYANALPKERSTPPDTYGINPELFGLASALLPRAVKVTWARGPILEAIVPIAPLTSQRVLIMPLHLPADGK